jgi:gliding motility-associated lipoprotein GldH
MYRLLIPSALLLILTSCDSSRVYETNQDFEHASWAAQDTALFTFSIQDTSMKYNVLLNLRNSNDFETARIFLNYKLLDTASLPVRKRLIEQTLFDKKTGKPFGKGGVGDIYNHQFLVESNITFPNQGAYSVKLSHMMRTDTLRDILSVGVRVERVMP